MFPLYWYEKAGEKKTQSGFQFEQEDDGSEIDGYIRRDGVSDVALANFRKQYADQGITKEDIFITSMACCTLQSIGVNIPLILKSASPCAFCARLPGL